MPGREPAFCTGRRRYLSVLGHLGIAPPTGLEFELPQGKLPEDHDNTLPYIILHPYARGKGKRLGPDLIQAFAKGAGGHRIILVGRGETVPDLPGNVEDRTNRTDLLELIGLLRGASFIVSSDSGPMHLAAALHPSRTLAIHLWSDPLKVGPCFPESLVWKGGRISRVADLEESWRRKGRTPSVPEMEDLGRKIAEGGIFGQPL